MKQADEKQRAPTISIGMPVFNCEMFIREAIDSLLAQTYSDFELIISDNSSTDSTDAICREYASRDRRIKYIRQSENRGPTANFQFVLSEAMGDYFMWAAGDDKNEPEFVERLLEVFKIDEEVVLAMSDVKNISERGTILSVSRLENIRIQDVTGNWKRIRPLFFENPTSQIFYALYGLFRTATLRQISLDYFGLVKFASGSEIPILAQVATKGKIASIAEALKIYRRQGNSVSMREEKATDLWMRLRNLTNISSCLIKIAMRSELPLAERLGLLRATLKTGFYKISGFLLKRVLRPILSLK